jgi:hypothetical protein
VPEQPELREGPPRKGSPRKRPSRERVPQLRELPPRKGSPRERPSRERVLRGKVRDLRDLYDGHGCEIYIEARYSKSYRITLDELRILRERVHDLAVRVRLACAEKLASFCGPEQVGELPEVPSIADLGELPEAPSPDDPGAFQAWREALMALTYERGQQEGFDRGQQAGFDRGEQAGFDRGQQAGTQALWSILFERRLGRPLHDDERALLRERNETLGPDRVGDVVLDLSADELAAWLADPGAR